MSCSTNIHLRLAPTIRALHVTALPAMGIPKRQQDSQKFTSAIFQSTSLKCTTFLWLTNSYLGPMELSKAHHLIIMSDFMRHSILRTSVLLQSIPTFKFLLVTQSTIVLSIPVFLTSRSTLVMPETHPTPQKQAHSRAPDYLMAPFH